jgi:serine/threonine protein kinase
MTVPDIRDENGNLYSQFTFYKKGGMGEIYKGIEKKSNQEIVAKLILIADPTDKELLVHELESSLHLSHKNIVKTYSSGEITIDGNNYLYIVQKYYSLGNLRSFIRANIPIEKCISMIMDILSGMEEMHKIIVHRDLKPENILIDSDKHLCITDFGLSKYIDEKTRTRSYKGGGTIPYMSPECWMGDSNTKAMDIYSAGIIFFEILTGKHPYTATTEYEWRNKHMFTPMPDISAFRSDLNTKHKQIIQKMTAKNISDRYSNISDIISALNEAIKLSRDTAQDIERLAAIGNMSIQKLNAEKLRIAQEAEKTDNWIKLLNYHITDLFNKITDKANAINERFEDSKIDVKPSPVNEASTNRNLTVSFNGKSIIIKFMNYNIIERYEKEYHDNSINFQKRMYQGFVLQPPGKSYLEENKIVLVGIAETTFKIGNCEYGFNLLLKKQDNSTYGEWYKMVFSKNIQPTETSFGLDLNIFFKEYEKHKGNPFYTVKFDKLTDQDTTNLMEKILW